MKRRDFIRSVGAASAALALPLSISACGSSTPAGNGKVTINWWHISTQDPGKTDFQNMANQYMQAHKNVTVKISIIDNTDYKTKLQAKLQANDPPDIFQSWGGGVLQQYVKAGQVQEITSALQQNGWGDSFSKAALDLYSFDGKNYGVPWDAGAVGFWYNPDLFTRAGIAQPPATWDDLLASIPKLKAIGVTPMALGEKDTWTGHFYWVYLAVRLGGKAAFDKAYNRTGSFADPPFVQAGQMLQQLNALKPFENGFLGADYGTHQALIGNGKAAMELMGQWAPVNDAAASVDKKGKTLAFFPFPAVPGGAGDPGDVMGGGNGFAIGKNAPPETVDFVRFLTNATNESLLAKHAAAVPPVKGAADAVVDQMKPIVQLLANAKYYQLYYDQYLPQTLATTILEQTQALYAGTATPQAAAQAIEATASTALQAK